MKLTLLMVGVALLLVAGCGEENDQSADESRTWSVTVADNISRNQVESIPCSPKLRKQLREANEVAAAGEIPVECARTVVADKLPAKTASVPAKRSGATSLRGPIKATVTKWSNEKGWGSLRSTEAPGGIFVHFSVIEGNGYRSLRAGQTVQVQYTQAVPGGQDGNAWVAERVVPRD